MRRGIALIIIALFFGIFALLLVFQDSEVYQIEWKAAKDAHRYWVLEFSPADGSGLAVATSTSATTIQLTCTTNCSYSVMADLGGGRYLIPFKVKPLGKYLSGRRDE